MRHFLRLALTAMLTVPFQAATALAATPNQPTGGGINPGLRIGEWIYQNVAAVFAPVLGLMAIYYLIRRQFTQFLSFAVFAVFAALFVFAGSEFKDAAVSLARWVIGR